MSDATDAHQPADGGPHTDDGRPRRKIIGTPPPAKARTLLAAETTPTPAALERELPAEPSDPRSARQAERAVAACFLIAMLAGFFFIAAYFIFPVHNPRDPAGTVYRVLRSNLSLGASLSVALLALGAGMVIWVRNVMPWVEITEQRHLMRSEPQDREAFAKTFEEGAEASQITKRPILRRTLIAASVPLGLAPLILLRDTGPLPHGALEHTVWRKGMRLLKYGPNTPIRADYFPNPGLMITVAPEGFQDNFDALAKAAVVLFKFRPGELVFGKDPARPEPGTTVRNWTVDSTIVAYSKICTHVGCPAALYEQTTQHILCPCHQSTFDARRGAQVIFGPATRPLPQLPITTDAQGYLVAQSDFDQPVGPSFWERS